MGCMSQKVTPGQGMQQYPICALEGFNYPNNRAVAIKHIYLICPAASFMRLCFLYPLLAIPGHTCVLCHAKQSLLCRSARKSCKPCNTGLSRRPQRWTCSWQGWLKPKQQQQTALHWSAPARLFAVMTCCRHVDVAVMTILPS